MNSEPPEMRQSLPDQGTCTCLTPATYAQPFGPRVNVADCAVHGLAAAQAERDRLRAENAELREELGYRSREDNGYCMACGCYMPQTLDGTKRVHDCDRTPPLGKLPATIYACPTCAGHAPFSAGCWGTPDRPHEHVFMRPIHELLRAAVASDEQHPTPEEGTDA